MLYLLHYGALSNPLCYLTLSQGVRWGNTLIHAYVCMYLYIYQFINIVLFTVVAQDIVIARPGQNVEVMCDVDGTEENTLWRINGSSSFVSLRGLSNGSILGHSISGRNIVVKDIMMNDVRNGSRYECIVFSSPITSGNVTILYVAGECND